MNNELISLLEEATRERLNIHSMLVLEVRKHNHRNPTDTLPIPTVHSWVDRAQEYILTSKNLTNNKTTPNE